jgi:hypothetical protein
MVQKVVLQAALTKLISGYRNKIDGFNIDDFLKTGVDPFRFTTNVSIWGLQNAIRKEIEHKVEMALENLIGDFHEDYLGNCVHVSTNTKWEKVPEGSIPGIDIANRQQEVYLQIKSKHNSMNSSSSKKLAEELEETLEIHPNSEVGCIWVVATQNRKAIGENTISEVATCYKGKQAYAKVTGVQDELKDVLTETLSIIPQILSKIDFGEYKGETGETLKKDFSFVLDESAIRVADSLNEMAKDTGKSPIEIVTDKSIN